VLILLDQGTPVPLRRALPDHSVVTAYEKGWATLTNGELLAAAEGSFDVFVTTDQNLRYQQNLTGRRLAVLVLPTTSWPRLQLHAAAIATAVAALRPGELQEWSFPD
jgi:hypothetical protein